MKPTPSSRWSIKDKVNNGTSISLPSFKKQENPEPVATLTKKHFKIILKSFSNTQANLVCKKAVILL